VDTDQTQDKPEAPAQDVSNPDNQPAQPADFRPQKSEGMNVSVRPGLTPQQISFPNKNKALVIAPSPETDAVDVFKALDLERPNAVLLLLGGTDNLADEVNAHLVQLLSRGVARAAAGLGALIIDGGRQTGAMAMMGQGVADRGRKSPLMGVAPAGKVTYPNGPVKDDTEDSEPLDHNHSHFILTDGQEWGDETETIYQLAAGLVQDKPVVTILVGGNDLAKKQVLQSVRHNWPVIIIKGTGNLAHEIETLWQKKPPFIPDPELAEIISDGRLYFFPLNVAVNEFERQLRQLAGPQPESDDTTLQLAWQRFAMYDANAERQQKEFGRQQKSILVLGVLATLFALIQTQLEILALAVVVRESLYYLILIIPITLSLLIARSNSRNAGAKWILSRAGAESIKKEIYRYRARAEIYSDRKTKKLSRDIKLTRKIDAISSKLMQTEVNTSAMPSYKGPIPPKYGAAEGDDGLTFLTPDHYLKHRLHDQLIWYRGRTVKLEARLQRLQLIILLAGAAGTLLAAIRQELWIALTTALVTAFATFLEIEKVKEKLMRYNQTATDLANVESWWVALAVEERTDPANVDKLVDQTETTIHQEHAAWVQDMQDAMAELRAEQAAEEPEQSRA
jgi:hypothetical protein